MSDDDDEDSVSDHSLYSDEEAQDHMLFGRSSWCTEKPRCTAQDPLTKKPQGSIYSDENQRYSSKIDEYLPLVQNGKAAPATESCAFEHKQKAGVQQKRNSAESCSTSLPKIRETDQVVRDVRGWIKSEKLASGAACSENGREEEEMEVSNAAEFEKFMSDVNGSNSMRSAVRKFNITATLKDLSLDAVQEAFEKAQHECMLTAWQVIQQREQDVRDRGRQCAIADEHFRSKTAEAEDQKRHCVQMETKYIKEVSQLRDQLNHKRSEKLEEMNTDIENWHPLQDLDEDVRALVVACTEEQLKSSLTSESGLCGLIEAKAADAERPLKSQLATLEEALALAQNKIIEQAVEISKLRDRWNTRRRRSSLCKIDELSNTLNLRHSEENRRHSEGNRRHSEVELNRRGSVQLDESNIETRIWLPLQDLAAETRDLVIACTDKQLRSEMTEAGLAGVLESKVAAAKQTLQSKVAAAEDAIVHAQRQTHGQGVENTQLKEELEKLRGELEKQKGELDKQKEELDKQKEALDNHKDKTDLKTDVLPHKSIIEISCGVCGTPVAVSQDLISESRVVTGTVTKPSESRPKSQASSPRKHILRSLSPDSNHSTSYSNEQVLSGDEESFNPSDSLTSCISGHSTHDLEHPRPETVKYASESSPLQESGGRRGSDREAKIHGSLPISAGPSHGQAGKAKFLVSGSGALKRPGTQEGSGKSGAVLPSVPNPVTPTTNSKIEGPTALTVEAPKAAVKAKRLSKPNCPLSSGHSGVGWRKSSKTSEAGDGWGGRKNSSGSTTVEVSSVADLAVSHFSRANSVDSQAGSIAPMDAMFAQSTPTAPAAPKPAGSGKFFRMLRGQKK